MAYVSKSESYYQDLGPKNEIRPNYISISIA